ncbi:LOW QUALITY PROTEIN: Pol protein [Phytophthora palmivora]|uniref:Pol protein n=1 Tax=Phytophthora palmivora TaxID=4796 RepID=A0A2P4YAC7_9STRA|nr:LOW QUALITY PROTEIN: Pol protein [Phytophthora palmivora]
MALAQDKQKEYSDKRSRGNLNVLNVGDLVLLDTKNLPLKVVSSVESNKLKHRFIGPFAVLARHGAAHTIDLPKVFETTVVVIYRQQSDIGQSGSNKLKRFIRPFAVLVWSRLYHRSPEVDGVASDVLHGASQIRSLTAKPNPKSNLDRVYVITKSTDFVMQKGPDRVPTR